MLVHQTLDLPHTMRRKRQKKRVHLVRGGWVVLGSLHTDMTALLDFPLTQRISGAWDKKDTEIDLVAVNQDTARIRFGSCKRSSSKLLSDIGNFKAHVERFLNENRSYQMWTVEYVGVAPRLSADERKVLERAAIIPQPLDELFAGL